MKFEAPLKTQDETKIGKSYDSTGHIVKYQEKHRQNISKASKKAFLQVTGILQDLQFKHH